MLTVKCDQQLLIVTEETTHMLRLLVVFNKFDNL